MLPGSYIGYTQLSPSLPLQLPRKYAQTPSELTGTGVFNPIFFILRGAAPAAWATPPDSDSRMPSATAYGCRSLDVTEDRRLQALPGCPPPVVQYFGLEGGKDTPRQCIVIRIPYRCPRNQPGRPAPASWSTAGLCVMTSAVGVVDHPAGGSKSPGPTSTTNSVCVRTPYLLSACSAKCCSQGAASRFRHQSFHASHRRFR